MRVRIDYIVTINDDMRRAINAWYGRDGLASRDDVKRWYEANGLSADDDLAAYADEHLTLGRDAT